MTIKDINKMAKNTTCRIRKIGKYFIACRCGNFSLFHTDTILLKEDAEAHIQESVGLDNACRNIAR